MDAEDTNKVTTTIHLAGIFNYDDSFVDWLERMESLKLLKLSLNRCTANALDVSFHLSFSHGS